MPNDLGSKSARKHEGAPNELLDVLMIHRSLLFCLGYSFSSIRLNQVAKVQEELNKEKERTGNVRRTTMSAIKKRLEKDNREELDKHKEMFRAALKRAQIAEKKFEETRVELSKFKDLNCVATRQIKILNYKIDEKKDCYEYCPSIFYVLCFV